MKMEKILIKLWLFGAGMLFSLLCLNSCIFGPTINIVVAPEQGHPTVEIGGLQVRLDHDSSKITVDWGDGATEKASHSPLYHLYTKIGIYKGRASGSRFTVEVVNHLPDVLIPFWLCGEWAQDKEKVAFDPVRRYTGCGGPVGAWGIRDIDDDPIEIRVVVTYVDPLTEMVLECPLFDLDGGRIDGQWIPIQQFIWFANWMQEITPYPLCGSPINPLPPPYIEPPSQTREYTFVMQARDPWEEGSSITWPIFTLTPGCR